MQQGLTLDEVKMAMGELMIDYKIREKQYVAMIEQLQNEVSELKLKLEKEE